MALHEIDRRQSTSYIAAAHTRYVYMNTIYLDDETNKKVIKRKIIGKIDPSSGAMVDTGPVGRPRREDPVPVTSGNGSQEKDVASSSERKRCMNDLLTALEHLESDVGNIKNVVRKYGSLLA